MHQYKYKSNCLKSLIAGATLALFAGAGLAQTSSIPQGDTVVELQLLCAGLTSPVYATHAGDRSKRLFIVDQAGLIRIMDTEYGVCRDEPFLDLTSKIVAVNPFFDERGLLGLAFHPDFRHNGRLFVRYSAPRAGSEGEPCFGTSRGCHEEILAEYRVRNRYDRVADPASEKILFRIDEPQFNHNSGNVAFGPDGYLYFTLGDGGGAHDGLADVPPSHGPIGNGQNIETVLGSILRIDVDRKSPGLQYGIPRSNPFAGPTPGADEIFAYGLRNPYRFSFDNGRRTGNQRRNSRLFVADVGQALFEEINIVRKGGNYGWVTVEGFHCFDPFNPASPPVSCTGTGPHGEPLLNPVAEYNHTDGRAVIGGFVYRGRQFRDLYGKYVFGDFSLGFGQPGGRLFWLDADGVMSDIFEFQIGQANAPLGRFLFGFGQDEDGELYVLASGNLGPSGNAGEVYRLLGTEPFDRDGRDDDDDDDDDDYRDNPGHR
jgi:glucose/arabinose dehydrogenase